MASNKTRRPALNVDINELDGILNEASERPITQSEGAKLREAIHAMAERLTGELSSEKAKVLFGVDQADTSAYGESECAEESHAPAPSTAAKPKGHGRNPASAFRGAKQIPVPNPEVSPGEICPECTGGKLSALKPSPLVHVEGKGALQASVFQLERCRCTLCGQSYTAPLPAGQSSEKYAPSAVSMVALLKYGAGMPFNRIEVMQARLEVPLPASTQWDLVADAAEELKPVFQELVHQAAQGEVLHHDDTSMRLIEVPRTEEDTRTGVFTTGVISQAPGRSIALFFTGPKHAGENLGDLLAYRNRELSAPTLMCDALSRNIPRRGNPDQFALGNCLVHGRRNFVKASEAFPEECRHVIGVFSEIYYNDRQAKESGLDPKERLRFHQEQSGPLLRELHKWMNERLASSATEDNSRLGKAMKYLIRHWQPLTLFLRKAGAPLDNNICERGLKMVVLHRKNALFYRTLNGSETGDLFMSLIQTCILHKVNPFHYLTQLLTHSDKVQIARADWLPWNYEATLAKLTAT